MRHAPAHQREALRREIDDRSADGCAVGEPGLDRVPVGRGDVERLAGDLGAGKIRDQMLGDIARSQQACAAT